MRNWMGIALLGLFLAVPALWPDAARADDRAALARQYARHEFKVVDVSEIELDGAKTLAITFSAPLDDKQNFSRYIHLDDRESGKVDAAWELNQNLTALYFRHLEPSRKLTLSIDPGLLSIAGKALAAPYSATLESSDLRASIGFTGRGSLLPSRLAEGLPVVTLNVEEVQVDFYRVRENRIEQAVQRFSSGNVHAQYDDEDGDRPSYDDLIEIVYSGVFKLQAPRNKRETVLLPIIDVQALQQPGVYLAVMRKRGDLKWTMPATLFTLSDVGLSAHRSRGGLEIFAQSLENGGALANVELALLDGDNNKLSGARTDAQGRARLPLHAKANLILAKKGRDTTVLRLAQHALDLSEFDIQGERFTPLQFFAFGPRDLYRPGETILLNGLLRDADGRAVAAQPVKAEVLQPDGETKLRFSWNPEAEQNGFYRYRLKLSENDPTGNWRVVFDFGDPERKAEYAFKLEEFLPERMALELKGGDKPLTPRDEAAFHVNGRYLYGAPASGNALIGKIYVRPLREAVPALPGYEFGSITENIVKREIKLPDTALDDEGEAVITPENEWSDVKSPIQLIYEASLQESGGRPVTRRVRQPVWPAGHLAGVRPLFRERATSNSTAEFEIVVADAAGNKLAAQGLEVRLIRERRDYYWSYYNNRWQYRYAEKVYTAATDEIDVPQDSSARIGFPVEWGPYRIEIEDPRTRLVTSARFWAGYDWEEDASANEGKGASRPDQVKLTLDQAAYAAGEVAAVTVRPPAAGSGYLAIESSDGPLWWKAVDVPADGARFEIPIPAEWARHDLYVVTQVVRPGDRKTYTTPKRAVGVLHLPLDRQKRRLELAVDAPEKTRPSQPLAVRIKARDADGKAPGKTRVLVSAVDLGILNITSFKTPDPFASFFGRKRYEVDQLDVYGQLIEAGRHPLARVLFGGDADLADGGKRPDANVQLLALQSEAVVLDENGEAEIKLDIPDFNGSVRIMAQAWNDGQYGAAEAESVIAAPLVAELAAPRFLAGGDETRLALDLTNLTGEAQKLEVRLEAEDRIALKDAPARQSLELSAGQRQTLLIPVRAKGGHGNGRITLAVDGLKVSGESLQKPFERSWKIGVRPPYPAENHYFRATLAPGESWTLGEFFLDGYDPDSTETLVGLSSKPPLNLSAHIRDLATYPYGCLEQTTSGIFPAIYVDPPTLKKLGITGDTPEKNSEKIAIAITRLGRMQHPNGGFGLWSAEGPEEFWLTVYATDFLARARERGYSVPEGTLSRAIDRLLQYLRNAQMIAPRYSDNVGHLRFATRAYAAYVLSRNRKAPLGELRSLFEQRADAKTGLSLVHLGAALQRMGDNGRGATALAEGLGFQNRNDGHHFWYDDYSVGLRDEAMIYAILEEQNLVATERPRLLLQLVDRLAAKRRLSTMEKNSVFLAGRMMLSAPESEEWRGIVEQDGKSHALGNDQPRKRFAGKPLTVKNDSAATLYLAVALSGYPLKPTPISSNLSVAREYLDLDGWPADLSKLKSGELILAHLTVGAGRWNTPDALVVDLLPAGLELENQNLGDAAASLDNAAEKVRGWRQSMADSGNRILHQEFRDDRYVAAVNMAYGQTVHLLYLARAVTPGEYIVPPPTVHAMYRPEWQAIGAAPDKLKVVPR